MTGSTTGSTIVHDGIQETNRRFEEAFNAGDFARAAEEVYTHDASVLAPDAPLVKGRDNIGQFWQAAAQHLGIQRVALKTVELEEHGDHAHEIGHATLTLAGDQHLIAKYVVIWRHEADRWRWHIDIWNNGV